MTNITTNTQLLVILIYIHPFMDTQELTELSNCCSELRNCCQHIGRKFGIRCSIYRIHCSIQNRCWPLGTRSGKGKVVTTGARVTFASGFFIIGQRTYSGITIRQLYSTRTRSSRWSNRRLREGSGSYRCSLTLLGIGAHSLLLEEPIHY